jgi:N-acetylneuraminic acid mutarotase
MESPFVNETVGDSSAVSTMPVNAVKRQRVTANTAQSVAAKKSRLSTRGAAVALRFENTVPQSSSKSSSSSSSTITSGIKVQEASEKAFARLVNSVHEGTATSTSDNHSSAPLTIPRKGLSSSRSSRPTSTSTSTSSSSSPITRILSAGNEMQWSAVEFAAGCSRPTPRWGQAATLLKPDGGEMLINGGESADGTTLADTYILSVPSSTKTTTSSSSSTGASWSVEPYSPDAPSRKWHSLVHWHAADRGWILALGQLGDSKQDLQQTEHQSSLSLQSPRGSSSCTTSNSTTTTARDSAPQEEENPCTVDDLSTFDPSCSLWFAPAVTGRVPINRHGHSMTLVPTARMPQASALQRESEAVVVVFGGVRSTVNTKKGTRRMQYLNDLYAWPVSSHKWHHIATTEGRAPKARSFHSAVAVGSKLIVFGGTDGEESFDDVSYLLCEPTVSAPDTWAWHQPSISGKGPSPRAAASATVIGNRFVLFIGGHDPTEDCEQLSNAANADSSKVKVEENVAKVPNGPSSDFPIKSDVRLSSEVAALIVSELSTRDQFRKSGSPFADAWLLDTHLWEWIRLAAPSSSSSTSENRYSVEKFCGRAGHSAALIHDARALVQTSMQSSADTCQPISAIVLFGGKSEGGVTSDVSVLTLPQSLLNASLLTNVEDAKNEDECCEGDVEEKDEIECSRDDSNFFKNSMLSPMKDSANTNTSDDIKVKEEKKPLEDDGWGEVE